MPLEWELFASEYFLGNEMSLVGTVASYRSKRSVFHFVPEQGTRGSKEWKKKMLKEDFFLTIRRHHDHQTDEDEMSGTHT